MVERWDFCVWELCVGLVRVGVLGIFMWVKLHRQWKQLSMLLFSLIVVLELWTH